MSRFDEVPAGELRHRIVIRQKTVRQDATGQEIPAPKPAQFAATYAKVEQVRGGETVRGVTMLAETTDLVTIRYIRTLKPTMWIEHDGRTLHILSIADRTGRYAAQLIQCKELP